MSKRIAILVGTMTGTAEIVAEDVRDMCKDEGWEAELLLMDDLDCTVFGRDAMGIPAPAVKSMLGNTFAASGTIEAAVAAIALSEDAVPPTINLAEPDPACDLDYVTGSAARSMPLRVVAVNNANLGGDHASLVLGRAS